VGLNPDTPFRLLGEVIEPSVSVPNEKPTKPAAVAEPEPAEEPLAPCEISQGFFVFPPNQTSPLANAPELSLAINTAPAASSFLMTVAVWSLFGLVPMPILL